MASKKSKGPAAAAMAPDDDWKAESDLRTLIEAEKIKADPKRLRAAMKKKRETMKSLAKV